MRVWLLLIAALSMPLAVAAQELRDIDPKELRVVISASEFVGAKPAVAKRRPEGGVATPGSSVLLGVDELEVRAGGYVHNVLHTYHIRKMTWLSIDLGNLLRSIFKNSSRPLTIEAPQRHVRGGVYGDYVQFSHSRGSDEFKCVAYVLNVDQNNRLIGYACNPPGLSMTTEDAVRHLNSVGIKGVLEPG